MYKVIEYFEDLQDDKYAYNVGDIYPREGLNPPAERIKSLASKNNRRGEPLIKKAAEPKETKINKKNNE